MRHITSDLLLTLLRYHGDHDLAQCQDEDLVDQLEAYGLLKKVDYGTRFFRITEHGFRVCSAAIKAALAEALNKVRRLESVPTGARFTLDGVEYRLVSHDNSGSMTAGPACERIRDSETVYLEYVIRTGGARMVEVLG